MPIASTNLKCDSDKTEDGLCDWIQLGGVNFRWFPFGRTYLCKCNPVLNNLVRNPLRRTAHHWAVLL